MLSLPFGLVRRRNPEREKWRKSLLDDGTAEVIKRMREKKRQNSPAASSFDMTAALGFFEDL